jgi:hypothetical protein
MIAFSRFWAMPSSETFTIPPIRAFVKKYLRTARISVDPFARDGGWATYTNDLNPKTKAQFHLPANEFLALMKAKEVRPDLVLFDPPYNLAQIKECYQGVGKEFGQWEAQHGAYWQEEKDLIRDIVPPGGIVLSFGWNSNGMGLDRGFKIVEIMLMAHGGPHADTICMAEKKVAEQGALFDY